jgi:hypothetical protein
VCDELAEQARRLLVGGGGAQHGDERIAVGRAVPRLHEQPREAISERGDIGGQDARHDLGGIERPLDRGDEEVLLGAEEVGDERGIDAGVPGDGAERGAAPPVTSTAVPSVSLPMASPPPASMPGIGRVCQVLNLRSPIDEFS